MKKIFNLKSLCLILSLTSIYYALSYYQLRDSLENSSPLNESQEFSQSSNIEVYRLINDFTKSYYKIQKDHLNHSDFKKFISPTITYSLESDRENMIKYLLEKNLNRSVKILKISKSKSSSLLKIFLQLNDSSLDGFSKELNLLVTAKVSADHNLVTNWNPSPLATLPHDSSRNIYTNKGGHSIIEYPCQFNTPTLKNNNGQVSVTTDSKKVILFPKKPILEPMALTVRCGKRIFTNNISTKQSHTLLYSLLDWKDSKAVPKILTKEEKAKIKLEKKLGIKIINHDNP